MLSKKQTGLETLKDICNVLDLVVKKNLDETYKVAEIVTDLEKEGYGEAALALFSGIFTDKMLTVIFSQTNSIYNKMYYRWELQRDIKNFVLPLLEDYEKIDYLKNTKAENFKAIDELDEALQNQSITKDKFIEYVEKIKYVCDWFEKYLNFTHQEEKQQFNSSILPFSLKYFSISNFQCIKHIEAQLPVDAQFIVFTGENGDGKTSILQALGLGLYNAKDLTDNEKGNIESAITVQYKANENSYHNEIYNNPKFPTLYSLRNNIEELKNFAAYGASRLTISEKKDLQNPLLNLITEKSKLYDITETWLRDIAANEPKKYEAVCDILINLLPNVSEIRKVNPTKIISDLVFIEKGVPMELKNLSAGHKSIVLMIGDMLMRLAEAQPEIINPKDFAGIVLIDELETHLHPKWQKEFPKILAETSPKYSL